MQLSGACQSNKKMDNLGRMGGPTASIGRSPAREKDYAEPCLHGAPSRPLAGPRCQVRNRASQPRTSPHCLPGLNQILCSYPLRKREAFPGIMIEVTRILSAIHQGDPHAAEQLLPLVYDELRKLAAQKLAREKP